MEMETAYDYTCAPVLYAEGSRLTSHSVRHVPRRDEHGEDIENKLSWLPSHNADIEGQPD